MIRQLGLKNFKCFEVLDLDLSGLTLLSGANASGKSSLLQALVLLHQTIQENEWSSRLVLNGELLKLGTVQDVVNKTKGRNGFELSIISDDEVHCWSFSGERSEMSMQIRYCSDAADENSGISKLHRLVPAEPTPHSAVSSTLESLVYITAERIGPREFYPLEDRSGVQSVGPKGEYAISRLFRLADALVSPKVTIDSAPPVLMRQVEAWMQLFFPGSGLEVAPILRMNAVTLGIRNSDETDYHRPINVGFGLTQVLPILVAALSAEKNDLILIENPEVHLHPAGQALMGEFLAQIANAGPQVIVETHSDHVLNGIRRAVRGGILSHERVALHFFRSPTRELDQVVSPQIDREGNIDVWPDGFFDQFDKDMNHFAGWES